MRVEWLGIGIWGNRRTAPGWTTLELEEAFLAALGDGKEGQAMRAKAKELAASIRGTPGREVAAKAIIDHMHGAYEGNVRGKQQLTHREL